MVLVRVVRNGDGHRLVGDSPVVDVGNDFLDHLVVRRFSPATVRAYAFDVANFAGFLTDGSLGLSNVEPSDLFDYLDWQQARRPTTGTATALQRRVPAPATLNRRIAAVRGLFEDLVMRGDRDDNPVPAARRSSGFRGRGGMLGHVAVRDHGGGRLVREPSRLPESIDPADVAAFLADLNTYRDRAMVLVPELVTEIEPGATGMWFFGDVSGCIHTLDFDEDVDIVWMPGWFGLPDGEDDPEFDPEGGELMWIFDEIIE